MKFLFFIFVLSLINQIINTAMNTTLTFISAGEIFFVILAALLLFGSKRIPEVARGLGKGLREIKKVSEDIKNEITEETDIVKDIKDIKNNFKL